MLQLSQVFSGINLEIIILIFVVTLFIIVSYQIIHFFLKDKITVYLQTPKIKKILDIATKISLCIFVFIFIFWNFLLFVPAAVNFLFPAENTQKITLKNNSEKAVTYLFIGKLADKNLWKPINLLPEILNDEIFKKNNFLNISPAITLEKNEAKVLEFRTELKYITHLNIMMLEEKSPGGKSKSFTFKTPKKDVILYSESFSKKESRNLKISLIDFYISVAIYLAGIASFLWIFTQISGNSKRKKIIFTSLLSIAVLLLSYLIFLNIKGILLFI